MKELQELKNLLTKGQAELSEYVMSVCAEHIEYHSHQEFVVIDPYPEINHKPLVCVHLDTIDTGSPISVRAEDIMHNKEKNLLWLSKSFKGRCLGGDDRCGVLIALELYRNREKNKTPMAFAFFWDEEWGLVGSSALAQQKNFLSTYGCFIGLDRRAPNGIIQAATYGYDNEELQDLFEFAGCDITSGTITDCAELSEGTEDNNEATACINLSVGYDYEHSTQEVIYLDSMMRSLETMRDIEIPLQRYTCEPMIPAVGSWYREYLWHPKETTKVSWFPVLCDHCRDHVQLYESGTGDFLCLSCMEDEKYGTTTGGVPF